ncbi:GYF domain-containing protein [Pseudomonas sp. FEN]|uniref:GYF domain-containing protein n=1 Tax=Pseudomonas sp. FEN TaxID=2767468 RepID=UPI00174C1908|nr:GYF domain-containing protein [Pseudomonas sp. FEN]
MPEATSSEQWFYEEKGQRQAANEQQIVALIRSGKLTYGSLIWKKGLENWIQLERTEFLQHLQTASPPPLTGASVNNTLVWLLAFAPLLGYLLEAFVAGATGGGQRALSEGRYWYLTVILNVALSLFDEKRLKKAGHDTRRFKGWVFIVPVYLYQRAKMLNQNLAYFIVWIGSFALTLLI